MVTTTERHVVHSSSSKRHVYFLVEKNPEVNNTFDLKTNRLIPTPQYRPSTTVPTTSTIVWPGGKDPFGDERPKGVHLIRYYVGCTNLFVDKQPKDKDVIEALLRNSGNHVEFIGGRHDVYDFDVMKKMFMDLASYNADSKYRNPRVRAIYKGYDEVREKQNQGDLLKLKRKALNLAADASEKQLAFHAKFLGIPFINYDTQDKRDTASIRIDYEAIAESDPQRFIDTYGDKALRSKYWIQEALDSGLISTSLLPGSSVWTKNKTTICNVGDANDEEALGIMINYATSTEGKKFYDELEKIFG